MEILEKQLKSKTSFREKCLILKIISVVGMAI
jgi:hypothetical protein